MFVQEPKPGVYYFINYKLLFPFICIWPSAELELNLQLQNNQHRRLIKMFNFFQITPLDYPKPGLELRSTFNIRVLILMFFGISIYRTICPRLFHLTKYYIIYKGKIKYMAVNLQAH